MNKCNCEGCKISRDHNRGYQPCHNGVVSPMRPPKEEDYQDWKKGRDNFLQNTKYLLEGSIFPNTSIPLEDIKKKYAKYDLHLNTIQDVVHETILSFNNLVESAIEDYFLYKYNISKADLLHMKEISNNFKLKGFEKLVFQGEDQYLHQGSLFLIVDNRNRKVYKLWEKDND